MDYYTLRTLFQITIYLISFLVFVAIVKFKLKKQLNEGKILLAGFLVGIFLSIVFFSIGYILYDPTNPSPVYDLYMKYPFSFVGSAVGEGIVSAIAFLILYEIGKPIHRTIVKKSKIDKQKHS